MYKAIRWISLCLIITIFFVSGGISVYAENIVNKENNNEYSSVLNYQSNNSSDVFKFLSAGYDNITAVLGDGTLWEWGQRNVVKNSVRTNSYIPTKLSNSAQFVSVSTGDDFAIALKEDGTVWSWGNTSYISHSSVVEQVYGLGDIIRISAGNNHAVALKEDGTVWAWGSNQSGQLGNGTTITSVDPIQVTGITDVKMVAAGYDYTMALKEDGTVWVWGANNYNYDGINSIIKQTPVQVTELDNVVGIYASISRSAVVKSDGTVWTWGNNYSGILGDGTTVNQFKPVQIPALSDVKILSLGIGHTIAINNTGNMWAWGHNGDGELGDATTTDRLVPTIIDNNSDFIFVTTGYGYTVAIKEDGTAWAWGKNNLGQLGNNMLEKKSVVPVQVHNPLFTGIHEFTPNRLSTSESHTLFIKEDGTVLAWGENSSGELGNGTNTGSLKPVQVNGLENVVSVSAGRQFSVALKNDGTVWAWGMGGFGRLGNDSETSEPSPVKVMGIDNVVAISAGENFTMALRNDGTVWAWGFNSYLGDGVYSACKNVPVLVRGLSEVKEIAAGGWHSLALKADGTVWSWGSNSYGELGDGMVINADFPKKINALTDIKLIRANGRSSALIKEDGSVWAWGDNKYGQLGDGTKLNKNVPEQIISLENIEDLSLGKSNAVAVKSDGTTYIWGDNSYGQICDGTTLERLSPVQLTSITDVASVSAGGYHIIAQKRDGTVWMWGDNFYVEESYYNTNLYKRYKFPTKINNISNVQEIEVANGYYLALKDDGTVWAWGNNAYGQLGDGTFDSKSSPTLVLGLSDVKLIAACVNTSIAVKNDGTVWAWGQNNYGQLGNGSYLNSSLPIKIENFTGVRSISLGGTHVLAVKEDGSVWAWGFNFLGQLGDGTTMSKPLPVQVPELINISEVFSIGEHSFAIMDDGTLFGWGLQKPLSQSMYLYEASPVQISGLTNIIDMSLISDYIYAVKQDGTLWKSKLDLSMTNPFEQVPDMTGISSINGQSLVKNDNTLLRWGDNTSGQLGDGTSITRYFPVQVVNLTNVKSYSFSSAFSAAVTGDGTIWVWGAYNYDGIGEKEPLRIFTASEPTISVESVALNKSALTLEVGNKEKLTATVLPDDAPNKNIVWSVQSGYGIVLVSPTGIITAQLPGTAVIRATSVADETMYAECTVTVVPKPITKAPLLTGFTWAKGSADGTTKATAVPNGTLKYTVGDAGSQAQPRFGDPPNAYTNTLTANTDITVTSGQHIFIAQIDLWGCIVGWADIAVDEANIKSTVIGGDPPPPQLPPVTGGLPPVVPSKPVPEDGVLTVKPIKTDNIVTADIELEDYKALLDSAKEINGIKNLTINIDDTESSTFKTQLPVEALTESDKKATTTIRTSVAKVEVPSNMFNGNTAKGAKYIGINIEKVDRASLAKEVADVIGNSPVLNISATFDGVAKMWNNPNSPVKISIPYTLQKGESRSNITVFYIDSKGKLENMQGIYNPETKMVEFVTTHFSNYFVKENEVSFTDLAGFEEYSKFIKNMASKGIIEGVGANKYSPDKVFTRAEFATLLVKMLKLDTSSSNNVFDDVESTDWFAPFVNAAYKAGLIAGIGNGRFSPDEVITNQDAAIILVKALKYKGVQVDSQVEENIKDSKEISNYALDSVYFTVNKGIIDLDENKNFNSRSTINRATAAKYIYNVFYFKN